MVGRRCALAGTIDRIDSISPKQFAALLRPLDHQRRIREYLALSFQQQTSEPKRRMSKSVGLPIESVVASDAQRLRYKLRETQLKLGTNYVYEPRLSDAGAEKVQEELELQTQQCSELRNILAIYLHYVRRTPSILNKPF